MSKSNKPSGGGGGREPKPQSHVLDGIYAETTPSRFATPPIVGRDDPPSYEQATTPRRALEAIQRPPGELRRNQAGSYGPNPSELPNRGDIDPMTGRRVVYRDPRTGWGITDGSNDIEIPEEEPPSPVPTRRRRARTPEISRQGLDSAYALLTNSELPNDPTVNAMTGDYQVARGPAVTPGQPSREYVPTGLSEGAKLRVMDADTSRDQSSVDLPSGSQSLAASIRSKASLTATKASAIGTKITGGVDKLVAKARGKKKRRPKVKKDQEEEEESEDEDEVTDTTAFGEHRKGDDPESPHPALGSRGGSATEVLNLFGFDPMACEPIPAPCHLQISALKQASYPQIQQIRHIPPGSVGRLTLQPESPPARAHQEPVATYYGLADGLENNKRVAAPTGAYTGPRGLQSRLSIPAGATPPTLSKHFLPKVKDVNSGLLLQQEITPGKLVKVKYAYSAKRADEFELEIELLLVVLLIASDSWALGSRYEDALDYIASRQELLPPGDSKLPDPKPTQFLGKSNAGHEQFKGRLPMMKFFPLEAVQLVQPYEWTFHPYIPTLTCLKHRSNPPLGSKRGVSHYKLHNPPPRGISKKPDLLYGENKRLVGLGYEKFAVEVLQKITEETRFSRIEEVSQAHSKQNTPPTSPTSSGWTSSSSPTSEWSYTAANSPAKAVAGVGKPFSGSTSPTSVASTAAVFGGTLPAGPTSTQIHPIASGPDGAVEDMMLVKLSRCEEGEMVSDFQPLEAMDNRTPKLIDSPSGKPGKKHLLKESWRWAAKRKEKLLQTILKKKNKGEGLGDGERSDTPHPKCREGSDSMEWKNTHEPLAELPNPNANESVAKDTKSSPIGSSASTDIVHSGQLCSSLELCKLAIPMSQDISARISRPSIRDLFTTDICVLNPNPPTSPVTFSGSTGSIPNASILPSPTSPEPSTSKASPPKLSINTQLISPVQLPLVQATKIKESVSHAKINSPSPRSPNDTGALGIGDSAISEYLGRGRERQRPDVDEHEGALSPTCTKDWAARGLIAKVKRAKESMRGIDAAVEECDDNDAILCYGGESLGGRDYCSSRRH